MFNLLDNSSNKIAIIDEDGSELSYNFLKSKILDFKKLFQSRGLVFLDADNDFFSLSVYCACLELNLPIALIDNFQTLNDDKSLINSYLPKYIFTKKELIHESYEKQDNSDNYNMYVYIKKFISLSNKISLLISTSGTLSNKKFVILSKKNLITNTDQIIDYLKITNKDVTITTLPFSYSYGLSIINTHIFKRSKIVLNNLSVIERDFHNKVNKFKVSSFGGVPFTYTILNKINFFKKELPYLRYVTQAGGKIKDQDFINVYEATSKKNIKFFIMYGQTEASPRISYVPYKHLPEKKNSIGIAVKNSKLKILNKKGTVLKKSFTEGEIIFNGKNIFIGYSNSYLDLKNKKKEIHTLLTGDIGYFDDDGFFYVSGRKKRIIKIFGQRINLDQIDRHLNKKFKCYSMEYKDKLIVYTENKSSNEKIYKYLNQIVNLNKNYITVQYINSFEKNANGKIIYKIYE